MFEMILTVPMILGAIIFLVACIVLLRSIVLIKQSEAMVIERLGKFDRILGPGIHVVVPFLERPRAVLWTSVHLDHRIKEYYRVSHQFTRIDLREAMYDFPKQNVITKDNVTMEINALLYYHITDVRAAVYEVMNLPEAIEKLTQTTLRNVIGSMDLDQSLTSRDEINERLRVILDEAADKWGVKITRVELQEVNPPHDIRVAMEKQMRAERDRRAAILMSEGQKGSAILEAEGVQESLILRAKGEAESRIIAAEGEAQARLRVAQAEAQAIEILQKAMPKSDQAQYQIALKYIQALTAMMEGKDNKTVVVPYEISSMIGSLAPIKELFDKNISK